MAGTTFSEIYDSFMLLVKDYRLTELYNNSQEDFENYLEGWLKYAIVKFDNCNQSLALDNTDPEFVEVLTLENILVLAELMVEKWLEQSVQDTLQMNLHLTDRDFKHYAESQNLKSKQDYLMTVRENLSQKLVNYGIKTVDWATWITNEFPID